MSAFNHLLKWAFNLWKTVLQYIVFQGRLESGQEEGIRWGDSLFWISTDLRVFSKFELTLDSFRDIITTHLDKQRPEGEKQKIEPDSEKIQTIMDKALLSDVDLAMLYGNSFLEKK